MFRSGFEEEVQALLDTYPKSAPAFKAIGYRQIIDYLDGKNSMEQAVEDIKMESRRYAKRQETWFQRDPGIQWIENDDDFEEIVPKAEILVEKFLSK
jgi:tRNA dimethylallyltransferase